MGVSASPLDTKKGAAITPLRNASGRADVTLAKTLFAASCKPGSRRRRTSRAPTVMASTSSGDRLKPGGWHCGRVTADQGNGLKWRVVVD